MTIRETVCLTIVCDGCREPFRLFDEYETYHFGDERDIPTILRDHEWFVDDGHWCPECECAKTGHELKAFRRGYGSVGYKSCECGLKYQRAVTLRDMAGRL